MLRSAVRCRLYIGASNGQYIVQGDDHFLHAAQEDGTVEENYIHMSMVAVYFLSRASVNKRFPHIKIMLRHHSSRPTRPEIQNEAGMGILRMLPVAICRLLTACDIRFDR